MPPPPPPGSWPVLVLLMMTSFTTFHSPPRWNCAAQKRKYPSWHTHRNPGFEPSPKKGNKARPCGLTEQNRAYRLLGSLCSRPGLCFRQRCSVSYSEVSHWNESRASGDQDQASAEQDLIISPSQRPMHTHTYTHTHTHKICSYSRTRSSMTQRAACHNEGSCMYVTTEQNTL